MAKVERAQKNVWTRQRISSIVILFAASAGFIYSLDGAIGYLRTKKENERLLQQKQELLKEYEMYQSLISDHNSKIIIQDKGYCYEASSNSFYKCE